MTFKAIFRELRACLAGREFGRSVERNRRAAEGLDAAVRELLRR